MAVLVAMCLGLASCAAVSKRNEESKAADAGSATVGDTVPGTPASPQELSAMVAQLNKRLEAMDEKVAALTDKLASTEGKLEQTKTASAVAKLKSSAVDATPADHAGIVPGAADEETAHSAEFSTSPAIEKYRSALILYDSGKLPEAMLEFDTFLKAHTDHPFAGAAQFHMGECYFRQGECKLAIEEYQHVLTGYEQSSYVPDALKRLSQCEEKLKITKSSARHRQLLLSLFPQSPAAKEILEAKGLPDVDVSADPIQSKLQSKARGKSAEQFALERNAADLSEKPVTVTETIKVLKDKEISVGEQKFPAIQVETGPIPTAPVDSNATPGQEKAPSH